MSVADLKRTIRRGASASPERLDDAACYLCPICQRTLDTPITLPCGHNYCHSCWDWWYPKNTSCPTCRAALPRSLDFHVNRVLQHCLLQIVPELQQKRKGEPTGGVERGGNHNSAFVTVRSVHQDQPARTFRQAHVVRRSCVVDPDNSTMQYCLAFCENQLCLLYMEEDEMNSDECPLVIGNNGQDDNEALICSDEQLQQFSMVTVTEVETKTILQQSAMRLIQWDAVLARKTRPTTTLRFVHEETTACLQAEVVSGCSGTSVRDTMESDEEQELQLEEGDDDDANSEDAAFLVEEDACYVCKDGGELLVCEGTCERLFHVGCIERDAVPTADHWICQDCAADRGITVTLGGYEYDDSDDDEKSAFSGDDNNLGDSMAQFSSDDEAVLERPPRHERSYEDSFPDEDDEEDGQLHRRSNMNKRQRLVDSDEDEEC